ncbi:MAG TPA: biotin--[acetyl-CoA-carboxylase] ligase [Polyangiaceae bacterium]|nr:biotin--[acetyl-CoA-carboxylase] ligase [Polyangiaceae bacterium]
MSFDQRLFEAERQRRGAALGQPVSWRDETGSTNDDALAAAKSGAPHGALFGAETQSRGRGRRGSEWVSTPGAGVWFSVLLRPELTAEQAPALSLCAGLAVRDAVAPLVAATVQVKWPNDVLADGRKLAGILIESQLSGSKITSVIVGIGLNVAQTEFPQPIASIATSLALLQANDQRRESVLASVLCGLEQRLAELRDGGIAAIAAALRPHDALTGKKLRIDSVNGTGAGIDDSGQLLVCGADGTVTPIVSGHVEIEG